MDSFKESVIKKIARYVVFHSINIISVLMWRPWAKRPPLNESPNRIVIIELARIGDLLMSMPFYISLRKTFPSAHITLICTPGSKVAVENCSLINEVHLYDAFWEDKSTSSKPAIKHFFATARLIKFFFSNRFDVCFSVMCRPQPIVPLIAFISKTKTRIGFAHGMADNFFTHPVPFSNSHIIQNKLSLLSTYYPNALIQEFWKFPILEDSKRAIEELIANEFCNNKLPIICISPSTAQKEKMWGNEKWADLINQIIHQEYVVLISGGISDIPIGEKIARMVGDGNRCKNVSGKCSLNQYAALLEHSRCLLTVESTPMHIASSIDLPTIVLMSRLYDYTKYMPLSKNAKILTREADCCGCEKGCKKPTCMDFTVEEVYDAFKELINSRK
jgi:ADP-heptose:LPS heptosyltransferase